MISSASRFIRAFPGSPLRFSDNAPYPSRKSSAETEEEGLSRFLPSLPTAALATVATLGSATLYRHRGWMVQMANHVAGLTQKVADLSRPISPGQWLWQNCIAPIGVAGGLISSWNRRKHILYNAFPQLFPQEPLIEI